MPHVSDHAGNDWDAVQYLRFAKFRRQPALDLINAIPLKNPNSVYDLGCGTGKVTALLAEMWPHAKVTGIDKSDQMLERAQALETDVYWMAGNIQTWQPEEPADLIFSNASLHWVPDHASYFPHLFASLNPGGCLAIQMPLSWHAPSHQLMRNMLLEAHNTPLGPQSLRDALNASWVEEAQTYYDILSSVASEINIWSTTYYHPLEGKDPVFEWVKGAGLRPVLKGLDREELDIFIPAYKAALRKAYPRRADGKTIFPFQRLFIVCK